MLGGMSSIGVEWDKVLGCNEKVVLGGMREVLEWNGRSFGAGMRLKPSRTRATVGIQIKFSPFDSQSHENNAGKQ